jgi:N-acetylmuramoyl-L-alanine amidase
MVDCILERRHSASPCLVRRAVLLISLGAVACLGASAKPEPGKVTSVRFWSLGDVTRIAIEVSSEFHYRSDRLTDPERVFFDIQGAKPEMLQKGMHVINVGDALLKQIRVAETHPGVTRIVLDLEKSAAFTASQLSNPDRLMIELRSKDRLAPPAVTSVTAAKAITDTPVRPVEPDVERELSATQIPLSIAVPMAAKIAAKPELRRFEAPPPRPDPPRPKVESKPVLLTQPNLSLSTKLPKAPAPAPAITVAKGSIGPPPLPPFESLRSGLPLNNSQSNSQTNLQASALPLAKSTTEPLNTHAGAEPTPAKHNLNGERSLTRVLGLKLGRVVLDPGHGGYDGGTHGPSGLYEKDVVLDVARRLGALLEDRLGSEVIFTRSDDTFISLERRTQIANEGKADLFLSIHANSSPFRSVAGVEAYYLSLTAPKTSLDTAMRENASSSRSVFDLRDLVQKIALNDKIGESREFAARVDSALYGISSKSNPTAKNRGVKKAPFVVLIGASMPSVLAEIGFLTNASDELMLKRPDHRQKIAEALYKGIANYADTLSHFQVAKRE